MKICPEDEFTNGVLKAEDSARAASCGTTEASRFTGPRRPIGGSYLASAGV